MFFFKWFEVYWVEEGYWMGVYIEYIFDNFVDICGGIVVGFNG